MNKYEKALRAKQGQAKKYAELWEAFEKTNNAWFAAGCPEGPLCEAWEKAWKEFHQ